MSREAKLMEVIVTSLTVHGNGRDAESPLRCVTQYWSKDGLLLAEVDPVAVSLSPEQVAEMDRKLLDMLKGPAMPGNPINSLLRDHPARQHGDARAREKSDAHQ